MSDLKLPEPGTCGSVEQEDGSTVVICNDLNLVREPETVTSTAPAPVSELPHTGVDSSVLAVLVAILLVAGLLLVWLGSQADGEKARLVDRLGRVQ